MNVDKERVSVYGALERDMLHYADYVDVPVRECGEPMVAIAATPNVRARQIGTDMQRFTGSEIYVRRSVLDKLAMAALILQSTVPGAVLEVVYGYRALSIQEKLFDEALRRSGSRESAHRQIAAPEVAGHPTGGAVDVQFALGWNELDFGTSIWSFEPDSYTHSPYIRPEGAANRRILRLAMLTAGFAPFDGEWWHFSFGDKEWARYYDQHHAIYEQIEFKTTTGVI